MDDFDRELWRADKYANIYGQDTAQSYLASVAEYASGCVWTVAGSVILLCILYPPALIGVGVLVAAWIVLSAASFFAPMPRRSPRPAPHGRTCGWTSLPPSSGRPPSRGCCAVRSAPL